MEILNHTQGSPEWLAARCGIPTASEFSSVLAKGRGSQPSKTRRTYLFKLAGERITGEPAPFFMNEHMKRGHELEPEVRDLYTLITENDVEQVGFIKNHGAGCSPDGMVGEGGLEIKTKLPHIQVELLLTDEVPPEHKPQIQGQIWVAELEWVDFVSYWPGMKPFIKRVYRDEAYIETLAEAVEAFNAELDAVMEKLA